MMMNSERSFNQFVEETLDKNQDVSNYDFLLELWSKFFGKENIVLRIFEKENLKGHIFHDFLTVCDVRNVAKYPFSESVNVSPHFRTLEIIRALNANLDIYKQSKYRRFSRILGQLIIKYYELNKHDGSQKCFIQNDIAKNILEHYEKSNQKVAKEYFGRDSLFETFLIRKVPEFTVSDLSSEEIIKMFGYVLPRLIDRIEKERNEKYPFIVKALIYSLNKINSIPILIKRITRQN